MLQIPLQTFLFPLWNSSVHLWSLPASCLCWLTLMRFPWLTICKTALMVLMTGNAVNNHLCDKPLNLCGRLRKKLRGQDGLWDSWWYIKFVYTLPMSHWNRLFEYCSLFKLIFWLSASVVFFCLFLLFCPLCHPHFFSHQYCLSAAAVLS